LPSKPVTGLVTIELPPAGLVIPPPPQDYSPASPGEFRGVVPRAGELTALPQALIDLGKFTTFDQTMGATAPTQAEVIEALTAASKWTTTCQATRTWLGYAILMQGMAWRLVRAQLDSLRPAYLLATKRNPKLAEQYGGLTKLLSVPKVTAQQGAVVKKLNKQAQAEGKPPTHGKVGKARERRAAKAALAAANAGGGTQGQAQAAATTAGAAPVAAPVAVAGLPTTNGASHS
jgi:hypothetical protein